MKSKISPNFSAFDFPNTFTVPSNVLEYDQPPPGFSIDQHITIPSFMDQPFQSMSTQNNSFIPVPSSTVNMSFTTAPVAAPGVTPKVAPVLTPPRVIPVRGTLMNASNVRYILINGIRITVICITSYYDRSYSDLFYLGYYSHFKLQILLLMTFTTYRYPNYILL
jgi:hypothetical protein